ARIARGTRNVVENAQRRLGLLDGARSEVPEALVGGTLPHDTLTAVTLWIWGREALDAGERRAADLASAHPRQRPHINAVLAALEGAATGSEDRWHEALAIALEQGLRLIAVDALEGLAIAAAATDSFYESLRLFGAAERLRDETGYAWRFPT